MIGRSLRAVVDLDKLGPRTITIDCDVLEADGGTRTISITGAMIALVDALATLSDEFSEPGTYPITDRLAAVSCGIIDGRPLLDLDYKEDFAAAVDMNVVMTGSGRLIEVQGTAEETPFSREQLDSMLTLAEKGIRLSSVLLFHGKKKGRIQIEYYSSSDLERILEVLRR